MNITNETQLEYLALGDVEERNFRANFMNITNDNGGTVYKAIEWAIEKISNLPGVEKIKIGNDPNNQHDLLVNHAREVAMYPYSIARESKFFLFFNSISHIKY